MTRLPVLLPRNHSHIIALRGNEQLAVAVDAPGEMLTITERDLLPKPVPANSLVRQVLHIDNGEIAVLDIKELSPPPFRAPNVVVAGSSAASVNGMQPRMNAEKRESEKV